MLFHFSLRQWLAITVMTTVLFGFTFRIYDTGYTPDRREIMAVRGDRLAHPWGSGQRYGVPFNNLEVFTSWSLDEPEESSASFQRRTTVFWTGIGLNLAFWFGVSVIVCLVGGRLFGVARQDSPQVEDAESRLNSES